MEYILSFSGGKDSTTLLLKYLSYRTTEPIKYPLDAVIFCDTGLEFPDMYTHIEKNKNNSTTA